jgi:hypothetical protein
MIDTNLLDQLRKLRLGAMADALQLQLDQVSTYEDLGRCQPHMDTMLKDNIYCLYPAAWSVGKFTLS